MAPETAAPERVTEDERLRAEEDQAQLQRILLFREERRRRRRSRLVAVATVTAGMLLLAAGASWLLRDRSTSVIPAAPASSAVVTQPIAPAAPIEKPRVEIESVPAPLPATPPVSDVQKPAANPSGSARAPSKAPKHAQAPVPPPKFLDRPHFSRETPVIRSTARPAPDTTIRRTAAPSPPD